MKTKTLDKETFKDAIRVAFEDDNAIFLLYCPNIKVNTLDDIVNDVSNRIRTDVTDATVKGIYEGDKLIGYYVYDLPHKLLVSFGLNKGYRSRKYLNKFWACIRSDLKGMFQCFLWTRNGRGIKWLQKNGMKIAATDSLITLLIS